MVGESARGPAGPNGVRPRLQTAYDLDLVACMEHLATRELRHLVRGMPTDLEQLAAIEPRHGRRQGSRVDPVPAAAEAPVPHLFERRHGQMQLLLELTPNRVLRTLAEIQVSPRQAPAGLAAPATAGMNDEQVTVAVGKQTAGGSQAAFAEDRQHL